ncbi:MAG: CotH kinase family protein, partial [Oscillospiraceae bacterium]
MIKIKRTALMALCIIVTLFSLSGCNNAIGSSDYDGEAEQTTNLSGAEYISRLFEQDVLKIEITTTNDDWSYLMENATSKPWISGDIAINGETISNVGIKTKGNTSLTQISQTDSERYSLKISFGKYIDGQTCYGLDKLVLNNIYADSTYLKEYMSYNLFNYMDVPSSLCTFADIYINGEHYGFYIALEDTDDSFLDRNYGEENEVEAYKPESMDMGGEGGMQNPNGNDNQGGNEGGFGGGKFDISSFISLTDKDGGTVEWADIIGDFDLSNIQSFTLEDGTVTNI